ncbi:MAG: acetyl-CoA carboxylase biotin carboxyl carrier protein [Planctomycetota bacterium]
MDLSKIKDLKDLQSLLDIMGQYELVELEIEGEGKKIRLRKAEPNCPQVVAVPPAAYSGAPALAPPGADGVSAAQGVPGARAAPGGTAGGSGQSAALKDVVSPMVGTFYRAPSPEAEPFVREGDAVGPDATLCIIEAMKVMNEIPAGISGIVREVLVKNGESVEFGQPLFRIEAV